MASTHTFVTNKGLQLLSKAYWESGVLSVLLLKDSYTPNPDHDFVNDIEAHECDATSYARTALGSPTATLSNVYDRLLYTAANTAFGSIGGAVNNTIRYAALCEILGGASSADPVVFIARMVDVTTPTTYTATWNNPLIRTALG